MGAAAGVPIEMTLQFKQDFRVTVQQTGCDDISGGEGISYIFLCFQFSWHGSNGSHGNVDKIPCCFQCV